MNLKIRLFLYDMYIFPYLHSTYKNNRSKDSKNSILHLPIIIYPISPISLIPYVELRDNNTLFVLKINSFSRNVLLLVSSLFLFFRLLITNQEKDIRTIRANVKFVSTLSTGLIEDSARINANIKGALGSNWLRDGIPEFEEREGGEKKGKQKDRD